jgi:16S rRNA (guanine966-N2)-methyltransferase
MRITGGEWRSRRLLGPRADAAIRPTPDALREQGFAVLTPILGGACFLDLFAGTGAVALEALSRGAAFATLVECDRRATELVRHNCETLGAGRDRCELLPITVAAALPRLARRHSPFDAGWCDPPFAEWDDGVRDLERALKLGLFAAGALVVLETPPRRSPALQGATVMRELRGAFLLRVTPTGAAIVSP